MNTCPSAPHSPNNTRSFHTAGYAAQNSSARVSSPVHGSTKRYTVIRIEPKHHVLPRHSGSGSGSGTVRVEKVILRRVGNAVDGQVHNQQEESPERRCGSPLLLVRRLPEHEERHAERDEPDAHVLVQREPTAVQHNIHQHHGHKLARLAEDHRWVIDVSQRSVAEGGAHAVEEGYLRVLQEKFWGRREEPDPTA
ncbi:hypothetical protein BC938DRAFT_483274 [Jimgerdemannia flammicorona]|uniref:Uncharacterized protein n=1 Tax=Jimgerdemannia flammicorona TaxID=994334 RepID=A0A433QCF6_9FUNG|nr:hypothetical protein BC938DRAFT_483274 [Jimgerdemannia flammicorona]